MFYLCFDRLLGSWIINDFFKGCHNLLTLQTDKFQHVNAAYYICKTQVK